MRRIALLALLAASPAAAPAQDAPAELDLFALDAQLSRETAVASGRARTVRETPGVVTVLEREELLASGARDLAGVLMRVPGFQLGVDVENAIGIGFRGVWGFEGKVLVLVDGIEMNDLVYGTVPMANHLLVDQLERVEIIRGPGSAVYGGHAELAVVNVVTRAASVSGASASMTVAQGARATTAASVTAAGGGDVGPVRVGVTAVAGLGVRGQGTYTDLSGGSFDMAHASSADPAQITAIASLGDASLRLLYDDYRTTMRDGYDTIAPQDVGVRWRTFAADARWTLHPSERLSVTPQVVYKREVPWQMVDPTYPTYLYDFTAERITGRLSSSWDATSWLAITAGAEAWGERARLNDASFADVLGIDPGAVTHRGAAAFAEASADTPLANLVAGARYDHHDTAGDAFVPRLAATRVFAPFHVKLLASGAFRAPSIENLRYGVLDANGVVDVRPERTWVYEAEIGCQAARWLYLGANAFDLRIERPIVFGYDPATDMDAYRNYERTGSRGVEAEVRVELPSASATVSWSWYDARGINRVPAYAVADHPELLVGFAGHKVGASAQLRLARDVVVTPSVIVLSDRWGYDHVDGTGAPALGRLGAAATVDLFATWRDAFARGLELGLGVRDLLDVAAPYIQPYDGGHAPLPGAGREIMARVRYER